MRRVSRAMWRRELVADHLLGSARTKLQLLRIGEFGMQSDGSVIYGAQRLGPMLGISDRQVARYLQVAYEAGWLEQTSEGYRGHAATYSAAVPDADERPQPRRSHNRERVTRSVTQSAPDERSPDPQRVTRSVTQSDEERVTRTSTLSGGERVTTVVTPRKNYSASVREHVAADENAAEEPTTTAAASQAASPTSNSAMTRTSATPAVPVTADCQPSMTPTATVPCTAPVHNRQRATARETPPTGLRFTAAVEREHEPHRQLPTPLADTATFARPSEMATSVREHDDARVDPPTCVQCGQQLKVVEPGRDTCTRCQYLRVAS